MPGLLTAGYWLLLLAVGLRLLRLLRLSALGSGGATQGRAGTTPGWATVATTAALGSGSTAIQLQDGLVEPA